MAKEKKALRWTVTGWAAQIGAHPRTVQNALGRARIVPGRDGKYSTKDMFFAISPSPKERAAREAKLQAEIDRADMIHNEREVQESQLADVATMKVWAEYILERIVQMIQSRAGLTKEEKRRWIDELTSTKFEPTKFVPFKRA